jgi:hypothetical protein
MFAFPILPKNGFGCFGMGDDGGEGWFDEEALGAVYVERRLPAVGEERADDDGWMISVVFCFFASWCWKDLFSCEVGCGGCD